MKLRPYAYFSRNILFACTAVCAVSSAYAQNGTWIQTSGYGTWSDITNWNADVVADGAGNTASFSGVDLPNGLSYVVLDTPRTLGNLTFTDTDITTAGSWFMDGNLDPLNILTLSETPVITVDALAIGAYAEILPQIAGTNGLAKAGLGTLVLSGPNSYSGGTTLNAGNLSLNSATAIGTGPLTITGGSLDSRSGTTLTTANAQNWNSNVNFTGTANLNLGTGTVTTGGILREVTATAGVLTVGGVITAPGLTKSGAGQLTISGNNLTTLVGPILLKGGTLQMGGGTANTMRAIGATTNTVTFEGGTLGLNGTTGGNGTSFGTFSNPLIVDAAQTGTVVMTQRGVVTSTLTGSGTLNWRMTYTRGELSNANWSAFTGTVNLINAGGGEFRIIAGNSYFNNTKLNVGANTIVYQNNTLPAGTVGVTHVIGELSGSGTLGSGPTGGRFLNWQVGGLDTSSEFSGVIQNQAGTTRLYKVGLGTLTLSGTNTYTGDTQLNAGKIFIGTGGGTGSLAATNVITTAGTELAFNRDNSAVSTYPGILSGPGVIRKLGSGQVNFDGNNTYTAGTLIEGGTIGINSPTSLGNVAGAVAFSTANGGVITNVPGVVSARTFTIAGGITASFGATTAADSLEITSSLTGAGALGVNGLGVLTLSAGNAYGGNTTVTSGTLVAANVAGSATSTGSVTMTGGKLGGTGTIAGNVTTSSGVELKPGSVTPISTSVGTLTTGGLALAGGTVLRFELADASTYDKVVVSGANALTSTASLGDPILVDPRFVNSTAKWTTPGNFDIIGFSGTFTGNADDLFEVPLASRQPGLTYSFAVVGNTIQLQIGGAPPSSWNVNASGTWTDAGNWLNGSPNGVGSVATFGSIITSPRTVTLEDNRTVGILQFNNANSYNIAGAFTINLDQSAGDAEISVLSGQHAVQSGLSLTDPLKLTLFNATDSLTLSGPIGGTGSISKISVGNLTLGGPNDFAGNVIFSNGILTFSEFALGNGNLTLDNASLIWAPGNSKDISNRVVTFGNGPVTFSMTNDVVLANDFGFTGAANLTKDGSGALTLTADTTFTGSLNVLNGNLNLGVGGASGSTLGGINLANPAGILTVNRSGALLINNLISGSGSLVLAGSGAQSLGVPNTFSGTTTISSPTASLVTVDGLAIQNSTLLYDSAGGTVNFGSVAAATFGALSGNKSLELANEILGGVNLTVGGNAANTTYTGTLSGLGSLAKAGAGTMILTAPQTYTGATTINGGALELEPTATITAGSGINVNQTGRLTLRGASIAATGLSNVASGGGGGAVLELLNGATASYPGGLNAQGNGGAASLINVNSGTLTAAFIGLGRSNSYLTEPAAGGTGDGLQVTGGDVDIAGALNLGVIAGANSSATVRMDAGSLDVGGAVTIGLNNGGRWSVIDINGGIFNSTDVAIGIRLGGPFQGNAAFLSRAGVSTVERFQFGQGALGGSGTVHVSGGQLYVGSGGMVVGTSEAGYVSTIRLSGGTLAAKDPWSAALPVATSGTFTIKAANAANAAQDITLSGPVTGTGSLQKEGDGTLTLSGANAYTGATLVNDGTLVLTTPFLSDTAVVGITTGALLNLSHGQMDTVLDFRINGVSQGSGIFNSANTGGLITGGSLFVPAAPYAIWINSFPSLTNPADKEKSADPDNDGINNLQEFALDGNPTSGASSGKVRSRIETIGAEQALVVTLPVRVGLGNPFAGSPSMTATRDRVIYTIRGSNDLTLFNQIVSEVIPARTADMPTVSGAEWTYHTFRLNGAISGATPRGPLGFLQISTSDTDF